MLNDPTQRQGWLPAFLQKLFGKRKVAPEPAPQTASIGQPLPSGQGASLIGVNRPSSEEWATANQSLETSLLGTQEPAPRLIMPKVSREEGAAAALIGLLGGKNPAFAGAALRAPGEIAERRAAGENADLQNAYQARIKAANTGVTAAQKQIGILQDRDEIASRVESQIKQTSMREQTKVFIAEAKLDQTLMVALAKVLESGGSLPAVKTLLMQRNLQMGISEDEDALDAKAQALYTSAQADPSMKMRIQMATQETKAKQADETQRNNLRKIAINPNATYEEKLNAYMGLADMGDPRFAAMTFDQMQAAAMAKGSVTAKNEAQTKETLDLLPYREQEFKDKHGLSQARAAKIAKETSLMDEESAAKLAKAYADIDNIRSQIGDREADRQLGYAKLKTEQLIRSQDGLKTALQTLSTQANSLRNRVQSRYKDLQKAETDEEKTEIQKDIDEIGKAIESYKKQYGEIEGELKRVRGALGTMDDSEPQPANAIPPVTPDLSGPIPGARAPSAGGKKPNTKKPSGFGKPR